MKSIRIRGKRNIDSMEGGKKAVRTGMDNIGDELMLHETQKTMVNKLYMGEDFDHSTTLKRELGKLISFEDTITKLVSSKLLCHYCCKEVKVLFKNVREPSQWTLDRMDNDGCHSNENTIIACMKCNLERRVTDIGKFTFTKRLIIKRRE